MGSRILVAVYLNDGYGHFLATDPSSFKKLLQGAASEQEISPKHFYYNAALVSQKFHRACRHNISLRNPHKNSEPAFSASNGSPYHAFLHFGSNRAPPVV